MLLQDRTYWRLESDQRLIEAARDSDNELCIALGERLEEARDAADYRVQEQADRANDFAIDINRLGDELLVARRVRERLERIIGGMAVEIEQLRSDA